MRPLLFLLALCSANSAYAQELDPLVTTYRWTAGESVQLVVRNRTGITITFAAGETIARVTGDEAQAFSIQIADDRQTLFALPAADNSSATIDVITDQRFYRFALGTARDGAYLAKLEEAGLPGPPPIAPEPSLQNWSYRIKGDGEVFPASIGDNGARTTIRFAPEQALPAVFAIGATGKEEVVNGHMRGDQYEIDRVYGELVFRIDSKRATARRAARPGGAP